MRLLQQSWPGGLLDLTGQGQSEREGKTVSHPPRGSC